MASINPENIKNIVSSAENGLIKKTLGGFTPESTKEALQKVANGVKQLADNAIGSVQKELQAYKGKTAQEMAELTSKKDAVILSKDKQIAEVKEKAKQQLKAATSVKTGKPKTLPNGNIETVKVNKNGARMTTETTPDGKKVNITVETIDGDIRKTKYDPVSGKSVKTYTNTTSEKVLSYDGNGKFKKAETVNIQKTNQPKPKPVSEQVIEENPGMQKIRKSYSDGSYTMIDYNPLTQKAFAGEKFNAAGKKIESFKVIPENNISTKYTTKFHPETGKISETLTESSNGLKTKVLYNEAGKIYKKVELTEQGLKRIITAKTDKYGNISESYPAIKYIYPKNSPIKEARLIQQTQLHAPDEILKMKDGSSVTIKINNNYDPYNVTIMKKGEKPKVLSDSKSINEYMEQIGKIGYRQDKQYYNNYYISK